MDYHQKRKALLEQMAQIDSMEKGTLMAEYRDVKAGGKTLRKGPYFKHQVWENGKNVSKRVSAKDAEIMKQAVDGYHKFKSLSEEYIDTTIEMTRKSSGSKKSTDSPGRAVQKDPVVHRDHQAEVPGQRKMGYGGTGERA